MKLPKARAENLVEQNLGAETLIYDLTTHKAFNLNETLSVVYQACDGRTLFDEIKRKHKFTDDFIYLALDELKGNNLLAEEYVSPFANVNRRDVIKKIGLATMFALPLIAKLVAPTAIQAASSCIGQALGSPRCTTATPQAQGDCCANLRCFGGTCAPCSGRYITYANISCNSPGDCSNKCRFSNNKNICCNSGRNTFEYNSVTQTGTCYCP